MRVLFLTNFYPPYTRGGMELTCQTVVDGLAARGHECRVLTSVYGCRGPATEEQVNRLLHLEMDVAPLRNAIGFFTLRNRRRERNQAILRQSIVEFEPDAVFVWGMWNLQRVLARDAEHLMDRRVLYRFGDYWPSLPSQFTYYWRGESCRLVQRLAKAALRPFAVRILAREAPVHLEIPASYCISHAVKTHLLELGIPVQQSAVIYNGIDLAPYAQASNASHGRDRSPYKLVFAGRLIPDKGAHVVIEALGRLVQRQNGWPWHLTLCGSGSPNHRAELEDLIATHGLLQHVSFLGQVSPSQIPEILLRHGVLVVPSLWAEPFGRTVVEGMAAGCAVVGSEIGAIPEIIEHGETGLLFPPGNADALAKTLCSLAAEPGLAVGLARNGRAIAAERFGFERMLEKVETILFRVAGASSYPIANGAPELITGI